MTGVIRLKFYEGQRVYLDTFDWRLFSKKMQLYLQKNELTFFCPALQYPEFQKVRRRPRFYNDLPEGDILPIVKPALGIRALIPVIRAKICAGYYHLVDKNEKTVLRILVEYAIAPVNNLIFVELYPVKGYPEISDQVSAELQVYDFQPSNSDFYLFLLREFQVIPENYAAKKTYQLKPEMSLEQSVKTIHHHLLKTMRANENGIIKDIDTEFLHDYRVAVRRTRSLYGQVKKMIDPLIYSQAKENFTMLGKRTNRLRDIDVYLMRRSAYNDLLPVSMQSSIACFFESVMIERKIELSKLSRYLQSRNYKKMIENWENYVSEKVIETTDRTFTVLDFARTQIAKGTHRVLEIGNRIDERSPDRKLHRLRIECKKLRYTLEFFKDLFVTDIIENLILHLKKLQDNLGEFNDLSIQQQNLYDFANKQDPAGDSGKEQRIAFGILIGGLYHRQRIVRQHFRENFDYFCNAQNLEKISELMDNNLKVL